jgi:hypothetical protein
VGRGEETTDQKSKQYKEHQTEHDSSCQIHQRSFFPILIDIFVIQTQDALFPEKK